MERPGHFQAEDNYFQDDRYKPPLWLGWGNDTMGGGVIDRNESSGVFGGIPEGG